VDAQSGFRWPRRLARPAFWVGAALLLGSQVLAVHTVGVHWDEFILLDRVAETARSGELRTGGRPGLAEVVLLPLVEACRDEMAVARRARWLWLPLTALTVAGFAALLAQVPAGRRRRGPTAAVGVALLVLVPAFFATSVQVRTDHLALLGGTWGGAALLASRRRAGWAAAAGALFAAGFLASQKLAYVAALGGVLALGQLALRRELRPRREVLRAALLLVAFGLVFAGWRFALAQGFEVPERHASKQVMSAEYLKGGLSVFDFYRNTIGWSQYREMLPTLLPHGLFLVALAVASVVALRRRRPAGELWLAWAVLGVGAAVLLFHAAAFRYFWLTLGLFPAAAFAVAHRRVRALALPRGAGVRDLLVLGWWLLLLVPALLQGAYRFVDTQAVQRETFAFIHANFERDAAGFHPEGGLFCRHEGDPIRAHVSHTIWRQYAGEGREAHMERMLRTFHEEEVRFLVESFRLNQFPVELRRFWASHYQPYRASVFVAGVQLAGVAGSTEPFELVVPGRYRWIPFEAPVPLEVDGEPLPAGGIADLSAGSHVADFPEEVTGGFLVLAVDAPPGPAPRPFYQVN